MTANTSNAHSIEHGHFPVERMLDFSDDLIAFAATLLVLSVHLPHKSELTAGQTLLSALLSQWPTYLGFFMSFVIITICWISHHNLFRIIRRADHVLLILNSFLLMTILLIPFGTALLGEYSLLAREEARTAVLVYGGLVTFGGIPFNLIWWHALRTPGLVESEDSRKKLKAMAKHYMWGELLYLTGIPLAFLNVWVSVTFYLILILLYVLPVNIFMRKVGSRPY
jgi:uncharacterized membrane protein